MEVPAPDWWAASVDLQVNRRLLFDLVTDRGVDGCANLGPALFEHGA